jgi:hypothetical protein
LVLPLLLATLTASATPASAASLAVPAAAPGLRYDGWEDDDDPDRRDQDEDGGRREHVLLSAWGGKALAGAGAGRSSSFFAGEVAWVLDRLDLGVQYAGYRSLRDADRTWTPVVLTRLTQRFRTGRGFDATFSIGFGAGKPRGWVGWYQVAIGGRLPLGPLFVGGELAFEQYDIIRLGGGLGVAF